MAKLPRGTQHQDPVADEPAPPRAEVAHIIDQLLAGQITREAATSWADQFLGDFPDEVLQEGLELLQMTDMRDRSQGPYLFGFEDLEAIRALLNSAPDMP